MTLTRIFPSNMDEETASQFVHIEQKAKEVFLHAGHNFPQIGNAVLLVTKLYESVAYNRDIFVLSILLKDTVSLDSLDIQLAKSQFHQKLESYLPVSNNRVLNVNLPPHMWGLHITSSRWAGKYYENSHTLSLLIQGLKHTNGNHSI